MKATRKSGKRLQKGKKLEPTKPLTKVVDASSPTLFQACATGVHINKP